MIKKFVLVFLSLLTWAIGTVSAQQPPGVHSSYVSIEMRTDALDAASITITICGGVVVDEKRKLIATSWHCVPNQRSVIEKPGVFSVGGMNAKLVSFSPESDTALFQVDNLRGLKAPTFKTPTKGEVVVASAYYKNFPVVSSMSDRFVPQMSVQVTLNWEGTVAAVANANRLDGTHYDKITPTQFKWIIVTGNSAPGFSGGPVFDKAGNFVGNISHANGGFTTLSSSENITKMIKDLK